MAQVMSLRQGHAQALASSQETSQFLRKTTSITPFSFPLPLLSPTESVGQWVEYERLFLSCLRTGDDKSAFLCLERLIERFGAMNEKIMALRGLYQEAVAENEAALKKILQGYDRILAGDPANFPLAKRRIALLRLLDRISDAIDGLTELVQASPTDAEAWSELADLYVSQGLLPQAVFCLEEVLLVTPNAWNVHAHLGDVLFLAATTDGYDKEGIAESMRRYCRSIELCNGYLRGYYGLKLTSQHLLSIFGQGGGSTPSSDAIDHPVPPIGVIRDLNARATSEITRATRLGTEAGYEYAELVAAKALLSKKEDQSSR